MKRRRLGGTDLEVSEICLGTMTFGWTADEKTSFKIMSAAFDGGINFFDTADVYPRWAARAGLSEEIIGRWLKSRPRGNLIIATKVRGQMSDAPDDQGLSWPHIQKSVEGSLRRLGIETIDLYQAHWPDEKVPLDETLLSLQDLIRRGKVRYIGLSNYGSRSVQEALRLSCNGLPRVECLQPNYSLAWRSEFESDLMEICGKENLGVIPYSPLARGYLTGKYVKAPVPDDRRGSISKYDTQRNARLLERLGIMSKSKGCTMGQISLSWLLSNPAITSPIVGASAPEQIKESLESVDVKLTEAEKAELDKLSA